MYGGLQFKSFNALANVALQKQALYIASNRKSLGNEWAHQKYISRGSFWDLKLPSNRAWGWRGILSTRASSQPQVKHLIGNGKGTHFWLDPWLDYGRLLDRFGVLAVN